MKKISKNLKYQRKHTKLGLCRVCSQKATTVIYYCDKHRLQENARQYIMRALRNKTIKRKPCEKCRNKNSQGHHFDYSKPLEVQWLCPKHHKAQHSNSKRKKLPKKYQTD